MYNTYYRSKPVSACQGDRLRFSTCVWTGFWSNNEYRTRLYAFDRSPRLRRAAAGGSRWTRSIMCGCNMKMPTRWTGIFVRIGNWKKWKEIKQYFVYKIVTTSNFFTKYKEGQRQCYCFKCDKLQTSRRIYFIDDPFFHYFYQIPGFLGYFPLV